MTIDWEYHDFRHIIKVVTTYDGGPTEKEEYVVGRLFQVRRTGVPITHVELDPACTPLDEDDDDGKSKKTNTSLFWRG